MVGGKLDMEDKRAVDKKTAEKMREHYGFIEYIECSSKTGYNVEEIFYNITYEMIIKAGIDFPEKKPL